MCDQTKLHQPCFLYLHTIDKQVVIDLENQLAFPNEITLIAEHEDTVIRVVFKRKVFVVKSTVLVWGWHRLFSL